MIYTVIGSVKPIEINKKPTLRMSTTSCTEAYKSLSADQMIETVET